MEPGDPDVPETKGIVDIHMATEHPQLIFFQGAGYKHWITDDFGQTFYSVDTPGKTMGWWNDFKLHPNREKWILAKTQRHECNQADAATSKWCAYDLFVSKVGVARASIIFRGHPLSLDSHPFAHLQLRR